MLYWFNTGRPEWVGFTHFRHGFESMARLLLILAAVVMIALPFTQQVWTWDRFLHGGQDFETTVLLILTSLCLVLVMARACRQVIKLLLRPWSQLLVVRCWANVQSSLISATCVERLASHSKYNLPLQI